MPDAIDAHVATWAKELSVDPLQEEIVARLHHVVRHLAQNRAAALSTDGLTPWQFKTLLMLRRVGAPYQASPSQLAGILGLTRGALSARLAVLDDLGLLTRAVDTHDRRRVQVQLTEAGHRALEATVHEEGKGEGTMLAVLAEPEKQDLVRLLRKLMTSIEPRR